MKSPYCGWDKDLSDDRTATSDFGLLPLNVKEEIVKQSNEPASYSNAVKNKGEPPK